MNKKVTAILSYCTILGWLVAYIGGDKENAKLDLNQGLIIGLATVAAGIMGVVFSYIPFWPVRIFFNIAAWSLETICVIYSVFGIINAARGYEKELPFINKLTILK